MQEVRASSLRRPAVWIALLIGLDLILQYWYLHRGWQTNPMLWVPQSDAEEYWEGAGRIAAGHWIGTEPFLSAPLYTYFLALIRALGGGLLSVCVIQIVLRSLTAALLYRLGARRLGHAGYGAAAVILFLALGEPAFYAQRILNSSLQLFLLAGFLSVVDAAERRPGRLTLTGCGCLLGLNVLANPTMLLLIPALPLWLGWRTRAAWKNSALAAGTALLMVAPATAHNWLATRGQPGGPELILVSAQSGITYAHGNSAIAYGVYAPVPGVSAMHRDQNQTAYLTAKAATGKDGWRNVNAYFLKLGLDWNRTHPREALTLHLRKASYLFFGRHTSDISALTLELRDPQLPAAIPLPAGGLPTGWLIAPALAGAVFLLVRRGRRGVPEILLLLLPMAIVIAFWYSPRYRLPLAIPACLLAPYGLAALARLRPALLGGLLGLLVIGGPFAIEASLRRKGFDHIDMHRAEYDMHVGEAWMFSKHPAEALERFQRAERQGYQPATVYEYSGLMKLDLASPLLAAGKIEEGSRLVAESLPYFTRALELDPLRYETWTTRGQTLLWFNRKQEGLADLRRALELARAQNVPDAALQLVEAIRVGEQG